MSKVSIEIDGLKLGLKIPAELASAFVEELQGYWVAASRGEGRWVAEKRCQKALTKILRHVDEEVAAPSYAPCEHCNDEITPEACAAKRGVAEVTYLTFEK